MTLPHNANPPLVKHSTVAARSLAHAIALAALASAALEIDGRPEDAALVDEALDSLTKAYKSAKSAPAPSRSKSS